MKLVACMIVKDDSEIYSFNKAIDSLINFVDEIYVTATGKDVKKIKYWCEKRKLHYSYFKWCDDFSAARNFNFSQAPKDTDYIFWMDADDVLIGGENLKNVAQQAKETGKDVVFFTYWYGCAFEGGEPSMETLKEVLMEQNRERLLKPGVTTWKKRLHETPVPTIGVKNNYTKYLYDPKERPLVVMHTSVDSVLPEKMQRNQRILELELDEERKLPNGADPRTILYLMKIYAQNDKEEEWRKCVTMGDEYLSKSGWDEERATCLEQMGIAWGKLGDNKKAAECFHQAIVQWPHQPLIHIRLATAYFNLQNYGFADYWMKVGANMDIDNKGSNLTNIKAMKLMYTELLLKMNYNVHKDTKKALESAKMLFTEAPTQEHAQQVEFLENVDRLNEACRHVDLLCEYLDMIGEKPKISEILALLPEAILAQPFAHKLRHKYSQPRIWGKKEICYFANFGTKHFESWSAKSLGTGIGGSETAIIELSKQWTAMGYHVTIYGDPGEDRGDIDGVTYLPWYHFNAHDSFNIFIQWRTPQLAGKVKAKKFYVDLHDIFSEVDYSEEMLRNIDKIFVKSKYHREFAPHIPDDKFAIVGNGINV